jgi:hypothetical protein
MTAFKLCFQLEVKNTCAPQSRWYFLWLWTTTKLRFIGGLVQVDSPRPQVCTFDPVLAFNAWNYNVMTAFELCFQWGSQHVPLRIGSTYIPRSFQSCASLVGGVSWPLRDLSLTLAWPHSFSSLGWWHYNTMKKPFQIRFQRLVTLKYDDESLSNLFSVNAWQKWW